MVWFTRKPWRHRDTVSGSTEEKRCCKNRDNFRVDHTTGTDLTAGVMLLLKIVKVPRVSVVCGKRGSRSIDGLCNKRRHRSGILCLKEDSMAPYYVLLELAES